MNTNLYRVIGIDLGTTYSAVAAFNPHAELAQIIPNSEESTNPQTTPSVVSVMQNTGQILVGRPAKNNLPANPQNTIIEIKREMGAVFNDNPVKVQLNGKSFKPQEISAFILMKMKKIAEQEIGSEIFDAVITVPAHFTVQQKKATEEAARLAGLYPRQIIAEPTAAAICYGLDRLEPTRKVYMVYDLGGGTFDVSIISVEEQKIDVIATSGDSRLGGGDFDDLITGWAVDELQKKYGLDIRNDMNAKARIKLKAEQAKILLSAFDTAVLDLAELYPQNPPRLDLKRDIFVQMIEPLLNKSLNCVDYAVKLAEAQKGVRREDITAILLVGGSSKIPQVRARLLEYFQKDANFLRANLNPDAVVARGAAVMATRFQPSDSFDINQKADTTFMTTDVAQDVQISLITEHSLGVGVQDNVVERIVELGTNIPVTITRDGFTNPGPAEYILVPVYQGEGQYSYENALIGELKIGPMESQPPRFHKFDVTFTLDRDGLLSMIVKHLNEGKTYQAMFEQKTGIKENELAGVRAKLLNLWRHGFGAASTMPAQPTTPSMPPMPPAPPLPSAPQSQADVSHPATPPASEIIQPVAPVPDQFKQIVRRAQRELTKEMNPELLQAFNAFTVKLNAGASENELVESGDELADVFDNIRR